MMATETQVSKHLVDRHSRNREEKRDQPLEMKIGFDFVQTHFWTKLRLSGCHFLNYLSALESVESDFEICSSPQ